MRQRAGQAATAFAVAGPELDLKHAVCSRHYVESFFRKAFERWAASPGSAKPGVARSPTFPHPFGIETD